MNRWVLKDEQWERVAPLLPGKAGDPGRTGSDNRLFLEAVLWMVRTGAPWRDLPERYGPWRTVASRFYRWQKAGVFQRLFDVLKQQADATGQLDWQMHFIDSTIVRAHQHAAGAKKGMPRARANSWPWS